MGINFSSFEIGRRALQASQTGVQIAGQNIANVNTPGYSRRSVQLATAPSAGTGRFQTGAGVSVAGVRAFRDRFVDSRLERETAIAGRLTARRDALAPVESALDATSAGSVGSALNNFFNSFRDLEAQPDSTSARAAVVAGGSSLAAAFNTTRGRLTQIRAETDGAARATADESNALAARVADLNTRISTSEHAGTDASALRDQRGEATRRLSELTGARAVETQDGDVTVTLGDGRALVLGGHASRLDATTTSADGLTTFLLDGEPAAIGEGALRGLLDAVGDTTAQISSLDDLASSVAARVNTLHASGTDLNGNPGANFFAVPANGAPVTAANFQVNAALKDDSRLVVASPLAGSSSAATVAGAIANLLTDNTSQVGGRARSFSSAYSDMVSDVGAKVRSTEDSLQTQEAVLSQITAQRDSFSGVSLDEEAINLLQFQKAYEAAARFLRVADEMTQTVLSLGQ